MPTGAADLETTRHARDVPDYPGSIPPEVWQLAFRKLWSPDAARGGREFVPPRPAAENSAALSSLAAARLSCRMLSTFAALSAPALAPGLSLPGPGRWRRTFGCAESIALGRLLGPDKHGELRALAELPSLRSLRVASTCELGDADADALRHLTGLTSLSMAGCKGITDASLDTLRALWRLRELDLSGCAKVTDTGIRKLLGLTSLKELRLGYCYAITSSGIQSVSALGGLEALQLSGCSVSPADLSSLSSLRSLRSLNLSTCIGVKDEVLAEVSRMGSLQDLDLGFCKSITDRGLESLQALTNLTSLNICMCDKVTDTGLASLRPLARLLVVKLGNCWRVSDAGVVGLGHNHRNLEAVDLRGLSFITDEGVRLLIEALAALRHLDLTGCLRVSSKYSLSTAP